MLLARSPLPPNSVVLLARDQDARALGVVTEPHDGTPDGIRRAAGRAQALADFELDASHVQSSIGATDGAGALRWILSPNLAHIAEAGSAEARWIYGR